MLNLRKIILLQSLGLHSAVLLADNKLDLSALLARASNNSPRVATAHSNVLESEANLELIEKNWLPDLRLIGNAGRGFDFAETEAIGSNSSNFNPSGYKLTGSLQLRANLYKGGKETAEIDAAKNARDINRAQQELARRESRLEMIDLYFELANVSSLQKVANDSLSQFMRLEKKIVNTFKNQGLARKDYEHFVLAIGKIKATIAETEVESNILLEQIRLLSGIFDLQIESFSFIEYSKFLPDTKWIYSLDLKTISAKDILISQKTFYQEQLIRNEQKQKFGDYLPSLDLVGIAQASGQLYGGLSITIPLLDYPLKSSATNKLFYERLNQVKLEKIQQSSRLHLKLLQLKRNLETSKQSIARLNKSLEISQKNWDQKINLLKDGLAEVNSFVSSFENHFTVMRSHLQNSKIFYKSFFSMREFEKISTTQ